MLKLTDDIFIGSSQAEHEANVDCILNVAIDLKPTRAGSYYHIGLIDGPGNPPAVYAAAVLTLFALKGKKVLICCHEGKSRSVSIGLMYVAICTGYSWDDCLRLLEERNDTTLSEPHPAHKEVFNRIDWAALGNAALVRVE